MSFGGGGGAGAGTPGWQGRHRGGAGGGIIYIRARDFQGNQGVVRANGETAALRQRAARAAVAREATSRCASGAGSTARASRPRAARRGQHGSGAHGPGGGGAGGVVLLQGTTLTCASAVLSGVAGQVVAGGTHGATPTTNEQPDTQGMLTSIHEAFGLPMVEWVTPTDGESTGTRPPLEGTTQGGARVYLFLDDAPLGSLEVPADGRFTFQPGTDLTVGPHQLRAYAERLGVRGATVPRDFTVGPLTPLELDVGCGCGAGQPAGSALFLLAMLLLVRLRGRRRAS